MKNLKTFLIGIPIVFLISCSDEELPEPFVVEDLRVLALVADNPEISTTGTATITPFITDLNGKGRTLKYSAEVCIDPGVSFGADPTCQDALTQIKLAENASITALTSPNYTGSVTETITITPGTTAPSAALITAGRTDAELFNGVALLVTYTLKADDGAQFKAFRRIWVSTKDDKNINPSFSSNGIVVDNSNLSNYPTKDVELQAEFSSSTERYTYFLSDTETEVRDETFLVSWYVTDGDLAQYLTEGTSPTRYTPSLTAPTNRGKLIIAVARDGRGGVAIVQKVL